jgi:hypothetical protein
LQNSRFHHDLLLTFFLSFFLLFPSLKAETRRGRVSRKTDRLPSTTTDWSPCMVWSVQTHRELEHMLSGSHKPVTCQESLNDQFPTIFSTFLYRASIRLVNIISHPLLFQFRFYFFFRFFCFTFILFFLNLFHFCCSR